MNEERIIEILLKIGYSREKSEELFDYYLSIDSLETLERLALIEMVIEC